MKNVLAGAALLSCAAAFVSGQTAVEPVTTKASAEARALLKAIYRISGRNVISGQYNPVNAESKYSGKIQSITGQWPALWGSGFGFSANGDDDIHARDAMLAEAKRQSAAGSLITLTWRAVRPLDNEPAGWRDSVQGKLTATEWEELLTPGTPLRQRWEAQVDVIAGYLKQLRDARIPVLWRPYPEANNDSFWWGGRPGDKGSAALYRQLFERLAVHHQLDNLIWVWNANSGAYDDFYPGPAYCDILSIDAHDAGYPRDSYTNLQTLAAGKPIALGEVDAAPTAEILAQQPLWAWFMTSADALDRVHQKASLRILYRDARTVHRGDAALTESAFTTPEPAPCEPVNPRATAEARALLKTVCAVSGKYILFGHHNFPNHLSEHSDHAAEVAGKYPYIWGSDFGFSAEGKDAITGRDAMIDEAKRQYASGSIITLMWHAVRPVDDEPDGWKESVQNKLTNFEWNELLTPGTNLHRRWLAQIDNVAGYLKRLQDAKIPVLWRPYHEANGNWFWWGGRNGETGYVALYRELYDRFVNHHHLDNLVWVWNSNAPTGSNVGAYAEFYPGPRYCDILATDVYNEFKTSYHDDLVALAQGKPVALGEVGRIPSPAILQGQPKWAWFMVWADMLNLSKVEAVQELVGDPRTLSRGDPLPGAK